MHIQRIVGPNYERNDEEWNKLSALERFSIEHPKLANRAKVIVQIAAAILLEGAFILFELLGAPIINSFIIISLYVIPPAFNIINVNRSQRLRKDQLSLKDARETLHILKNNQHLNRITVYNNRVGYITVFALSIILMNPAVAISGVVLTLILEFIHDKNYNHNNKILETEIQLLERRIIQLTHCKEKDFDDSVREAIQKAGRDAGDNPGIYNHEIASLALINLIQTKNPVILERLKRKMFDEIKKDHKTKQQIISQFFNLNCEKVYADCYHSILINEEQPEDLKNNVFNYTRFIEKMVEGVQPEAPRLTQFPQRNFFGRNFIVFNPLPMALPI